MRSICIIAIVMMCVNISGSAQNHTEQERGVLESDSTWLKEIIHFPIGFAPEIAYEGYEDLRFAKNWRDKNHEDFWCYMFVWHVKNSQELSAEDLEQQMKFYYDGLMRAVNKQKDFEVPETIVHFIKNEGDTANTDFIGKLQVHDSFNTEAMITLNVRVKTYYCEDSKTSDIVFKISPQNFNHNIWETYKDIKLREDRCKI